ncbi:hypothetical protein [Lysinibacillus xylanilyticus]|uniref:Transposase n=1 Tax=Lysinibacillus xylanilyticus TaxID=582475 RepID=A0ABT4EJV0_9BACI|nr:hypothetical protein [Lysinibacillus xylanilyticus]MCY9545912.1 hypothetical protein [Lysinibacillus xylanilyticus]MED3800374.1 hypothetical protein [Lysinibacillus xylanilyticus]
MKLSSLIEQEKISSYYNRKKILQRKQAGDAYRKNSLYFQPKKNPLLLELENLLLGHTDQDLYEQQKEELKEVTPQQQAIIQDLQETKKNVLAHERTQKAEALEYLQLEHENEEASIVDVANAKESLQILEQVKDTAQPSPQDLRVAASVNAQIQNGQELDESELDDSQPAFVREVIEVKVPERFSKELKLDPFADTIFGKSYAEAYKARTFKYASEKYTTHIQMAKEGYRPGNDSMFSMIA